MLKAILIDDEPDCIRMLEIQLKEHCPQVAIAGSYTSSKEALKAISTLSPNLVFLDVEMPVMDGFTLLTQLGEISFSLIFVTAYNEFAVKAFRFSALDYLLKPLESEELIRAVKKAESRYRIDQRQLEIFRMQMSANSLPQKIAVPSLSGVTFIDLSDIVYAEADSNYTKLFLTNGEHHLVSKTLQLVQAVLEERNFLRVHRQYLVNLDHIKRYHKGEAAYLVMRGDVSVPVAKNRKEKLVQRFGWL